MHSLEWQITLLLLAIWWTNVGFWVWWLPGEQYLSNSIVPSVKFGGGWVELWYGFFFRSWTCALQVKETLKPDILDNSMPPTLWEQFGFGPFLFHHDCAQVHKARSIKRLVAESCYWFFDNFSHQISFMRNKQQINSFKVLYLQCQHSKIKGRLLDNCSRSKIPFQKKN